MRSILSKIIFNFVKDLIDKVVADTSNPYDDQLWAAIEPYLENILKS